MNRLATKCKHPIAGYENSELYGLHKICVDCGERINREDPKKSWWDENGGQVIWIIIVGALVIFAAASNHWQSDSQPDAAPDCMSEAPSCV